MKRILAEGPKPSISGRRYLPYAQIADGYERRHANVGLPGEPVTVWVYDGSITVEYQAVTLSKYQMEPTPDRKQIKEVSHPRLARTPFRSPQLTLIDVGPDE